MFHPTLAFSFHSISCFTLFSGKLSIRSNFPVMASNENRRPLPKFGEWDVNDPASAEGFTVIFNKARNERKTNAGGSPGGSVSAPCKYNSRKENGNYKYPKKSKWFCCG